MSNALAHNWRRYRALPPLQRELATFGLMLLVGLTLVPLGIWIGGRAFLGDYARDPSGSPVGGLGALWVDYLGGIISGSPGYWLALLGPWLLLLVGRAMMGAARYKPGSHRPATPAKRDRNQPLG